MIGEVGGEFLKPGLRAPQKLFTRPASALRRKDCSLAHKAAPPFREDQWCLKPIYVLPISQQEVACMLKHNILLICRSSFVSTIGGLAETS